MASRHTGNVKQPPLWLAVEELHTAARRDGWGVSSRDAGRCCQPPSTIYQQNQVLTFQFKARFMLVGSSRAEAQQAVNDVRGKRNVVRARQHY